MFRMESKAVRAIADDNIGTLFRGLLWDTCRWVDRVAAVFELQASSIDLFFDLDCVVVECYRRFIVRLHLWMMGPRIIACATFHRVHEV